MSSEIDHPRQRTVAELLAAHGDAGATGGRRRRRREAEPDTSESVDDAAFVFGGAAPEVAGWSPDRSVLRDPVPPDDGSATWDPIAGRAPNGSPPRRTGLPGDAGRAGFADAATRGWGADDGGVVPGAGNRAPRNGRPDDRAQYGRSPAGGGSDGSDPNRSDPNRSDPNRSDPNRSDRYRPEPDRPGGYDPGAGSASAWTGGGWDDDDAGGWSADSGPNGGAGDRPNGGAAGAGRRNGRGSGVANGWSDAGTSSWSSGGSPDRFGPDLPASNGWAQGSVQPGDTTYSDVPRRNGANRPAAGGNARNGNSSGGNANAYGANAYSGDPGGGGPNHGDENRSDPTRWDPTRSDLDRSDLDRRDVDRGNPLGGRSGVDPRAANGSPARAGMPADLEAGRTQGDPARLATPPRDPAWGPRAGAAQPGPRRAPDPFTEQFAPVRTDGTAVLDSVRARPRPPVPGVEDDRGSGPATQVSAPFDLDDPRSAGPGRVGSDRAASDRGLVALAVDDLAGPDVADLHLADPSATQIRSRRPAPTRPSSSGQAWAGVLAQWILGALGGAALWVGFRFLWQELTVVAVAAAVLVTVGLVLTVRHLLRNDDRRTTVFAVLIGLLLTVSPALLVMLHR